jgi:T-complex protein 1 subunit delta
MLKITTTFFFLLCLLFCQPLISISFVIAGGGAPEIQVALRLSEYAQTLGGMESYCMRAFAEAMEVRISKFGTFDE